MVLRFLLSCGRLLKDFCGSHAWLVEVNFLLPGKIVRVLIVLLFAFSAAVETERCEQRHCN